MSKQIKFVQTTRQTEKMERDFISILEQSYSTSLKEIEKELSRAYSMYGKDGKLTMLDMAKLKRGTKAHIPRLQEMQARINAELASLNRGTPQKISGYLTNVYVDNAEGVANTIDNVLRRNVMVNFTLPPRNAIYQSSLNELSKLALSDNAVNVKQNVRRSITTSITQGEGIDKMAARIARDLEKNANNAARIARTETTRNMNRGRLDTFEEAQKLGIKLQKVWLAASDSRTRDSHSSLNGETRDMDEEFSNSLMYPGDPSGPAEEVINCRCTLITEIID